MRYSCQRLFVAALLGSVAAIGPDASAYPGGGYNTFTERTSIKPCLTYELAWEGRYETSARIHQPLTMPQLAQQLGHKRGSFRWLASRQSKVLLERVFAPSNSRHYQLYSVEVSGLKATVTGQKLNPEVWPANNPELALARCGDRFIKSAIYGGLLVVGYYFDFRSAANKTEFLSRYQLPDLGIEGLYSTIAQKDMTSLVSQVGLVAFQWGGEPTQLSKLVSGNQLLCHTRNLERCDAVNQQLVDYVVSPGGFRDQVLAVGQDRALATEPLKQELASYSSVGSQTPDWQWPPEQGQAKKKLLAAAGRITMASSHFAPPFGAHYDRPYQAQLQAARDRLAHHGAQLGVALGNCRQSPALCPDQAEAIPFEQIDQTLSRLAALERPLHLVGLCLHAHPSTAVRQDLSILFGKFGLNDGDCHYNFRYLNQLAHINLAEAGMGHIDFLAALTNLRSLNLSGNQIKDADALVHLTGLTKLDVSNNKIGDLTALKGVFQREGVDFRYSGNPGADD